MISILCNAGMRARHWKQMSDIVTFNITPDSGTTLRKMLNLKLEPFIDKFEGISVAASKVSHQWLKSSVVSCILMGLRMMVPNCHGPALEFCCRWSLLMLELTA